MTPRRQKIPQADRASALLAALCFCTVMGIALASYMSVCSQTLQLSSRNSQGTHSLELAETGMEEALWALNKNDWTTWTVDNSSTPRTATKTLGGFSFGNGITGSVQLTVENYDGSSAPPTNPLALRTLKATGQTTLADGSIIARTFQASAQRAPLFVNAIASLSPGSGDVNGPLRYGVSLEGSASIDSFDSNPATTEPGFGFAGVVSSATSVNLSSSQINGYVTVAASAVTGEPRLTYSLGARVAGPLTSMSTLIDASRLSTSPYQPVFSIVSPSGGSITTFPVLTTATSEETLGTPGETPTYYFPSEVNLTGSQVLRIAGPVVISVSRDFKIQNSAQIIVEPTGSLQVLLTGADSDLLIAGNGIKNETSRPKNVAIFDAAVSPRDNPEISTSHEFHGVVYAPNSDRDLTISSDLEFWGALVARNVSITGSPLIHYDVDLRKSTTTFSAIETAFVISAWQEIAP